MKQNSVFLETNHSHESTRSKGFRKGNFFQGQSDTFLIAANARFRSNDFKAKLGLVPPVVELVNDAEWLLRLLSSLAEDWLDLSGVGRRGRWWGGEKERGIQVLKTKRRRLVVVSCLSRTKEADLHHVNINLENIRRASLDAYRKSKLSTKLPRGVGSSTSILSCYVHYLGKIGYKQGRHIVFPRFKFILRYADFLVKADGSFIVFNKESGKQVVCLIGNGGEFGTWCERHWSIPTC
ncbi:hypothetical protein FEM48_Zijuj12G0015800 [Ziziphus jujuba var. spinosa]|uniref:Uncharacterized protein n=1 Tax=Ziziphus jujuba var. spinosa TaxID=714518 RepID=A0A978UAF6_ZIZJJ|nr:hypothetical protein FEM48_Zijuj12G0015800 [Ziziphus jujuba var. spinosa]